MQTAVEEREIDGEGGASGTMSPPKDPTDDGDQEMRLMPTMDREKPYPLGMSRAELDRRRQRSLTETSEFAFAPFPEERPAQANDCRSTTRDEKPFPGGLLEPMPSYDSGNINNKLRDVRPSSGELPSGPFLIHVSRKITSPLPPKSMGLSVYQPGPDSTPHRQRMNRTTGGLQSLPSPESTTATRNQIQPTSQQLHPHNPVISETAGGIISLPIEGGNIFMNLPKPESLGESYSNPDDTLQSCPDVQPPQSYNLPPSDGSTREDDSNSVDSDGYALATRTPSYTSSSGYRRRSSVEVGPQEESDLLRKWRIKEREELDVKSRKSEESHRQILDTAQKEMNSFYAKRLAELQTRKTINREKEKVFNAVHNIGKDSKIPLNFWEVVVSMLPPASTVDRFKSSGNRTPPTTPVTPQKLMNPSTFFSQQISTVPPPNHEKTNLKRGKDVDKNDIKATTMREEAENIPPVKLTDISRMRQLLIKLKQRPPDIFRKEPEFP